MILKLAFEEFIINQQIKGNSMYTVKYYVQSLKPFFVFIGDNYDVASVTLSDLNNYYISLVALQISSSSVQTYIRALRSFLNWCYSENYTISCLPEKFRLPKAKRKVIDILTPSEIQCLMTSFNTQNIIQLRNYCICLLMLDSGLRMSEITSLKLSSVHIPESYIIVDGKGNKQRIVPLGLHSRKALLKYISNRPPVSYDNLFLTISYTPIDNTAIKNMFRKLKVKTGIKRIRAHLLRHTFATLYLENGGDIYSLQSILGHTSLEMVKKYIHITHRKTIVNFTSFSPIDNLTKN